MLPTYANALAEAGTADGTQIVYAAAQGFQVVVAEKTHTLGIGGTKLGCIPSSDD
jgi:pyruvate/2-oxoglutarate dehydrogenase complex dihydrolipoamide dehydrogenase (E3) component